MAPKEEVMFQIWLIDQGNLIGAGREGSRFFFQFLSIFEIEKWFIQGLLY
jgi:hypothetical protein